ncbi:MAG TPA: retropepsin-like aspartic protease [Thermoanaerobaculia bacterium]
MPTYDEIRFTPPAPVAQVTLRTLDGSAQLADVPMLLDTGADVSLVPRGAVEKLGLAEEAPEGFRLVGFDGTSSTASVVELELRLAERSFRGRFLLFDQEWGILGRNVLNHLRILYDGPRLRWDPQPGASRSRP